MNRTHKKVIQELATPGAYLGQADHSKNWVVQIPGKKQTDCLHVQNRVVEDMRNDGLVRMKAFNGTQHLALIES